MIVILKRLILGLLQGAADLFVGDQICQQRHARIGCACVTQTGFQAGAAQQKAKKNSGKSCGTWKQENSASLNAVVHAQMTVPSLPMTPEWA
eukprot:14504-Pelagomonas_calceolata.AAC.2